MTTQQTFSNLNQAYIKACRTLGTDSEELSELDAITQPVAPEQLPQEDLLATMYGAGNAAVDTLAASPMPQEKTPKVQARTVTTAKRVESPKAEAPLPPDHFTGFDSELHLRNSCDSQIGQQKMETKQLSENSQTMEAMITDVKKSIGEKSSRPSVDELGIGMSQSQEAPAVQNADTIQNIGLINKKPANAQPEPEQTEPEEEPKEFSFEDITPVAAISFLCEEPKSEAKEEEKEEAPPATAPAGFTLTGLKLSLDTPEIQPLDGREDVAEAVVDEPAPEICEEPPAVEEVTVVQEVPLMEEVTAAQEVPVVKEAEAVQEVSAVEETVAVENRLQEDKTFEPLLQVDSFIWSSICEEIKENASTLLEQVCASVEQEMKQKKNIVGMIGRKAGNGTTTLLLSVAREMTARGNRVLVIDANSKRPAVEKMLKLYAEEGLVHIFAEGMAPEDVVILSENASDPDILPWSGEKEVDAIPGTNEIRNLYNELSKHYDLILVDLGCCSDTNALEAGLMADILILIEDANKNEQWEENELFANFQWRGVIRNFIPHSTS